MAKNKKYTGCKSWLCHQCKHYIKFLTVSSMQDICWNRGCFYESENEIQPADATDGKSRESDNWSKEDELAETEGIYER